MSRIPVATPADYATSIALPRAYNVAYPSLTDVLTVTATKSGGGASGATTYEVRDFSGTVVKTGSWSGSSQSIGTAGTAPFDVYGWFTLHLFGPDAGDGAFGTDKGTMRFVIAEDVATIPTSPTLVSNPTNLTSGLDAPRAHGVFSLGGVRLNLRSCNLIAPRQGESGEAVSATSLSVSFDGSVSSAGHSTLIWACVGDDTGAAVNNASWNLVGNQSVGSGANKVTIRIYSWPGTVPQGPHTVSTTNAAHHTVLLTELGPYTYWIIPSWGIYFNTGTSNSATLHDDISATADYEYGLITGFAASGGLSGVTPTTSPQLTSFGPVGSFGDRTCDAFGSGQNHTNSWTMSASANWVSFAVAIRGYEGGFNAYSLAAAQAEIDSFYSVWGQYAHANRPYRQVTAAIGDGIGSYTILKNYTGRMTQIVSDTYSHQPGFVSTYTGRNEPGTYSQAEAQTLDAAVKAGNASAKSGGPGLVTWNESSAGIPLFNTLADAGIFSAGGNQVIHYHDYNMSNGDAAETLQVLRDVKASLVSRSLTGLPIYMTEGGDDTAFYPGWLRARFAGCGYIFNVIAREILLGVPYERQFYYYDRRAGFDSVTTWTSTGGGPYAGWAMHRAWAREINDKTLESAMDFGDVRNRVMVGGVWRNTTDHTGTATILAVTGAPTVTYNVGGGSPGSLTKVDCFGNTSTVTVSGGQISLAVGDAPVHIRLPANITLAPVKVDYGSNLLRSVSVTAVDSVDGSPTTIAKLIDDNLLPPYAYSTDDSNAAGGVYTTPSYTFPRTITLTPASPLTGNMIVVACPSPNQWKLGALWDWSLQYTTDGTTWTTANSWTQTEVSQKNFDLYGDSIIDDYTNFQHYFEISLGGTKTIKGVRLNITQGSVGIYGESGRAIANTVTSNPNTLAAWIVASISEVMVVNTGATSPSNTVAPAVTGTTTVGQTLTCGTGTWTGTPTSYTYQWKSNGLNIGGATASTYVLISGFDGTTMSCDVTATNANGSTIASSNTVGPVVMASAPNLIAAPTVSGSAQQGSTLTSTHGVWGNTGNSTTYAYQWTRDGSSIGGATSSTYVSQVADVTHAIGCKVTPTNDAGSGTQTASSNTITVTSNATPVNTVAPAVTGTTTVGQTLSTTNGTWSNSPTGYTYQWRRDNFGLGSYSDIASATSGTYVLVDADDACHIAVVVTATNANGSTAATSNIVGTIVESGVPTSSVAPVVFGGTPQGSPLSCTAGIWAHSGNSTTYAYQWTRDGSNISSATSSTYVTQVADQAHALGCKVTPTNDVGAGTQTASSNTITVTAAATLVGGSMIAMIDILGW